jgi:hypothetical protein
VATKEIFREIKCDLLAKPSNLPDPPVGEDILINGPLHAGSAEPGFVLEARSANLFKELPNSMKLSIFYIHASISTHFE